MWVIGPFLVSVGGEMVHFCVVVDYTLSGGGLHFCTYQGVIWLVLGLVFLKGAVFGFFRGTPPSPLFSGGLVTCYSGFFQRSYFTTGSENGELKLQYP